jgi:uncharacterized repeat protein (TIGR01451 family)
MRIGRGVSLVVVSAAVVLGVPAGSSSALAAGAAPGYRVESIPLPTDCSAGGCDYIVTVTNSGSQATDGSPITITDILPAGMTASGVSLEEPRSLTSVGSCNVSAGQCTYTGVLAPDSTLAVYVKATMQPGLSGSVTNSVEVSGGGAASFAASFQNTVSSSLATPGLSAFGFTAATPGGVADTQAGDHPYEVTASFQFATASGGVHGNSGHNIIANDGHLEQEPKDIIVDLPPGFVGDTQVATQCTQQQLVTVPMFGGPGRGTHGETSCPPDSAVGSAKYDFGNEMIFGGETPRAASPLIYNMVPDHGYAAEFGLNVAGQAILLFGTAVPTSHGYVLQVSSPGILRTPIFELDGVFLTFWGVPASPVHEALRGAPSTINPVGFLTNPVDCSAGPLTATAMSDTWQNPGSYNPDGTPDLSDPAWLVRSTTVYPSITGCELLQFSPGIEVSPEVTRADEPTGVSVDIRVPQAPQLPPDLPTPEFKNVSVTLPSGLSISPSAGDGLQACTAEQIGLGSRLPGSCPEGSVLGTVQVTTPLLPEPLEGEIFLASPGCDPCSNADAADGNMFGIYLEIAGAGVIVKQHGLIYANTATGQLTTRFREAPEIPVSDLQVHFKGGLRASLATPQSCGEYATTSDITPWSSPITPDATPSSVFDVSWNGNGEPCPATIPFAPSFSAGTSNASAGQFSPLTLTFDREDREQDIAGIQVKTPPGLLGSLSGIPLCGEPQADLGTCPDASRIGSMTVAAGPGGHPFYEKGSLYLTGPYKGAPFGLSIVVPTIAGPFNLGNVVVRSQIDVDPNTAALTVTSDPLPQILDGIPLRLRTANVTVDRPGFIFNPTSCAQLHIEGTLSGAQGALARVAVPFAVSGCKGLGFAPKFSAYAQARTSRANGASLDVKLAFPRGAQSNISHVKVELPRALPSRLSTLQKACPAKTFEADPAACPSGSIVGVAKAITPVLPVALMGPVYFVSHGGEKFPNLIVVLEGYGVRVDLIGDTFISEKGITSSTFTNVPDVQVSSFELYLPEGRGSALAANGNLCKQKLVLPSTFTAQDGAQLKQNTPLHVTGCPNAKNAKAHKAHKARRARKASNARARRASAGRNTGHAHTGPGRSQG